MLFSSFDSLNLHEAVQFQVINMICILRPFSNLYTAHKALMPPGPGSGQSALKVVERILAKLGLLMQVFLFARRQRCRRFPVEKLAVAAQVLKPWLLLNEKR